MEWIQLRFWRASPDAKCKPSRLKLNGKMMVDPVTLVDDTKIGPQMASDIMNLKPQEIFELVEEELVGKNKGASKCD